MTTDRTFSEMIHGDTLWMKYQASVNRETLGQKERSMADYIRLITSDLPAMSAFRSGMGYGRGMHAKRKMVVSQKVVAEINKRHPALAAEHRVGRQKAERSIAAEMKALRDWKKFNWAHYYGRSAYDKFDQETVMKLTGPIFTDGAL